MDPNKNNLSQDDNKSTFAQVKEKKVDLRKKEEPLVKVEVTNPVTYLKRWWKRVIGNEGIDFRFRIKPLTAIAITAVAVSIYIGAARFEVPFKVPFFNLNPEPTPTPSVLPSPSPTPFIRETAFSGKLSYSNVNEKYYLVTSSAEAITLEVPDTIDLEPFITRRILATGMYTDNSRVLKVTDAADLELLSTEPTPIPEVTPSPSPSPVPTPSPSPSPTPSPQPNTS